MNAKPLDSCVSGLRITLIASATRLSALSQPLMSSAVTQAGRLPRKIVKLIRRFVVNSVGGDLLPEIIRKRFHLTTVQGSSKRLRVFRYISHQIGEVYICHSNPPNAL